MFLQDSLVRLRQINVQEVSGYIVEVIGSYLHTGVISGIASNTGQLVNVFYPLNSNPDNYVTSGQTGNFATKLDVTGNNSTLLATIGATYYFNTNPLHFITSGDVTGSYYLNTNPSGFITGLNTGSFITVSQTGTFVTTGQTGNFAANTGSLTGVFYLLSNPFGFITTGQTGLFYPMVGNPSGFVALSQLLNASGALNDTINHTQTNILNLLTGLYYPLTGNPSHFLTGFNSGQYVTNSQTGQFVTTGQTGNFAANTGALTNVFYLNTNPSGYISTGAADARYASNVNLSNVVFTTGTQVISGLKTFVNNTSFDGNVYVNNLLPTGGNIKIFDGLVNLTADFNNRQLVDSGNNVQVDWQNSFLKVNYGDHIFPIIINTTDWRNLLLYGPTQLISVDWGNQVLYGNNFPSNLITVDWHNDLLYGITGNLTLDWNNRLLTGIWNAQALQISGNSVITTAQTGSFGSASQTGNLTGVFYPLLNNPSGFILGNGFVNTPGGFIINDAANAINVINFSNDNNFILSSSYSDAVITLNQGGVQNTALISGFNISGRNIMLSGHTVVTGLVVRPTQTGSFITSGQTGQFYPITGNPSNFALQSNLTSTGTYLLGVIGAATAGVASLNSLSGVVSIVGGSGIGVSSTGQAITISGNTSFTVTGKGISGVTNLSGIGGLVVLTSGQNVLFSGGAGGISTGTSPSIILPTFVASGGNATVVVDWTQSNSFQYTLTGNVTFNFTGCSNGQTVVVGVYNTGIYTASFPTGSIGLPSGTNGVKWPNFVAPTQSTGNSLTGHMDVYTFIDLNNTIFGNVVKNFY